MIIFLREIQTVIQGVAKMAKAGDPSSQVDCYGMGNNFKFFTNGFMNVAGNKWFCTFQSFLSVVSAMKARTSRIAYLICGWV